MRHAPRPRSTRAALLAAGLVGLCAARAARAEDAEAAGGTRIAYSHKGQMGVHSQLGLGYRVLFPYDNSTNAKYCGASEPNGIYKSVCTGRSPVFLEIGLSYGLTRKLEAVVDARLGVETDFKAATATSGDRPRALVLAPGVKVYIDDEGSSKFFSTLQVAFDFTDFSANPGIEKGTDVGIRNVNGFQIDFHRTFGAYVHFGETISFVRWLRFEIDAGLGIQGRFP